MDIIKTLTKKIDTLYKKYCCIKELVDGSNLLIPGFTLAQGSWSLVSGLYEQVITDPRILATKFVDVIPDRADHAVYLAAEILRETVSSNGSVKVFSVNAPAGDIGVTLDINNVNNGTFQMLWYAANTGVPTTNPIASGTEALAAGSLSEATGDYSIAFGQYSGNGAGSIDTVFIGRESGVDATNVEGSIFLGAKAGFDATNADFSNFIGVQAGDNATNAFSCNFFGNDAGRNATDADESNFIGYGVGRNATTASHSTFIGSYAGQFDTVDNTGSADNYSILLGNWINTGGFKNSVLIGSGTGITPDTNTKEDELKIADRIEHFSFKITDSYADDAAAGVGGLTVGQWYQTDGTGAAPLNVAGIVMVKQ